MNCEALHRPLSIDAVRDGGVYSLALEPLAQTGYFFKVGLVDDVYVKMPSPDGLKDYWKYIRKEESAPTDIRSLDDAERFEHLDSALRRFPEFAQLDAVPREIVHFLLVHRIQYERLRAAASVNIPVARFALLQSGPLGRTLQPVLFQERVKGTTLWAMFDFTVLEVTRPWWRYLPAVSAQLSRLLNSELLNHIDWNIQNFVFREADQKLFYVDMKPTTLVSALSNEKNLQGIREYFVE